MSLGMPLFAGNRARPASVTLVEPTSITGLRAWYDSTVGVGGSLGGAISSWDDRFDNAFHLTGTSPNRPVYQANAFAGGTKPSVNFPSFEVDFLYRASPGVVCPNGYSVFVTFKTVTSDTVSSQPNISPPMTIVGASNSGPSTYCNFGLNGGNVSYCYFDAATTGDWKEYKSTGLSLANGNPHTVAVTHATNGQVRLYADGVQVLSDTAGPYNTGNTGFSDIGVGYGYADQFIGDVAEVIVYDSAIASGDVSSLHARSLALWT